MVQNYRANDFIESEGILPPGAGQYSDDIYGYFKIQVGNIVWHNSVIPANQVKLSLKLWGQEQPIFLRTKDADIEMRQYQNEINFEVRVQLQKFFKYLEDMSSIKIHILDKRNDKAVAQVKINMLLYLRRNVKDSDATPHEEIKDVFPIMKMQQQASQKQTLPSIGKIEINISSLFQKMKQKAMSKKVNEQDNSFINNELYAQNMRLENSSCLFDQVQPQAFGDDRIANSLKVTQKKYDTNQLFGVEDDKSTKRNEKQIQNDDNNDILDIEPIKQTVKVQPRIQTNQNLQQQLDNILNRGKYLQQKMDESNLSLTDGLLQEINNDNNLNLKKNDFTRQKLEYDTQIPELEQLNLKIDETKFIQTSTKRKQDSQQETDIYKCDQLHVQIQDFTCANIKVYEFIQERQIYLQLDIPLINSEQTDSFKINQRGHTGINFHFNQDIISNLEQLNEDNIEKILHQMVNFKLFCDRDGVAMEMGSGNLKLQKIILSGNLRANFAIDLTSKIPFDNQKQPAQDQKIQKINVKEVNLVPVDQRQFSSIGTINCLINFQNSQKSGPTLIPKQVAQQTQQELNLQGFIYIEKAFNLQKLPESQYKFNLFSRYKIFSGEVIESPVQFQNNEPQFDHRLVFQVNQHSLQKMERNPFIIEFWDNQGTKDKLLGLTKLNLENCQKSILDADNNIQRGFTANIYPLILYDGIQSIQDLKTQVKIGNIQLIFALGTLSQINKFEQKIKDKAQAKQEFHKEIIIQQPIQQQQTLEQKVQNIINQPMQCEIPMVEQKVSAKVVFQEQKIQDENEDLNFTVIDAFYHVMSEMKKNNLNLKSRLQELLNLQNKSLPTFQFNNLIEAISPNIKKKMIQAVATALDKNGNIYLSDFTLSFNVFLHQENSIKDQLISSVKELKQILFDDHKISIRDFENELIKYSEFGFLSKSKFRQILQQRNVNVILIEKLSCNLFNSDEYFFSSQLCDYFRTLNAQQSIDNLHLSVESFKIVTNLQLQQSLQGLQFNNQKFAFNQQLNAQKLSIFEIRDILKDIGVELSIWECLLVVSQAEGSETQVLYLKFNEYIEKLTKTYPTNLRSSVASFDDDLEGINDILNYKPKNIPEHQELKPQLLHKEEQKPEEQLPETSKLEENIKNQDSQFYNQQFKIEIKNLQELNQSLIDFDHSSLYSLRYLFPNTDDIVESSPFEIENGQKNYNIQMKSKHSFTLISNQKLENFLMNKNKGLLVQLIKKDEYLDVILGQTLIPLQDICDLKNIQLYTQRYVLFAIEKDKNMLQIPLANIIISMKYKSKALKQNQQLIEKQNVVERYLPKVGILNIHIENVQIANKDNQDYQIHGNIFHADSQLEKEFYTFQSYDFKDTLNQYSESYEIVLNEQIIDYFNNQSIQIKIQQQQKQVASCDIPLLQIITSVEGVQGIFELKEHTQNRVVGNMQAHITFGKKSTAKQQCKRSAIVGLKICEFLKYNQQPQKIFQADTITSQALSFQYSYKHQLQNYHSKTFRVDVNKRNCFNEQGIQFFDIADLDEMLPNFEVKIQSDDDTLIGMVRIGLKNSLQRASQNNQAHLKGSNYYTVFNPSDSKPLAIRVGIRFDVFLFDSVTELKENSAFVKKIDFSNIYFEKSLSMRDTQKLHNLTKDVDSLYEQQVRQDLQIIKTYQQQEEYEKLKKEFEFYDYDDQGFVDYETAVRILIFYESFFQSINQEIVKQYQNLSYQEFEDMRQKENDINGSFDYIVFLSRLQGYQENKVDTIQQVERTQDRIQQKLRSNSIEKKIIPSQQVYLIIESAHNLHYLNNGLPPNSYLQSDVLSIKTDHFVRSSTPVFQLSRKINDLNQPIDISIFHKKYNYSKEDILYQPELIGKCFITLQQFVKDANFNNPIQVDLNSNNQNQAYLTIRISQKEIPQVEPKNHIEEIDPLVMKNFIKTMQQINNLPEQEQLDQSVSEQNNDLIIENKEQYDKMIEKDNYDDLQESLKGLSILQNNLNEKLQKVPNPFQNDINLQTVANPFQNNINNTTNKLLDPNQNIEQIDQKQEILQEDRVIRDPSPKLNLQNLNISEKNLSKSDSLKNFEKKLKSKESKELDRIAQIMRQNYSKDQYYQDFSSDSDQ